MKTTIKDLKRNDIFRFNDTLYIVTRKWLSDEKPLIAHNQANIFFNVKERFEHEGLEIEKI